MSLAKTRLVLARPLQFFRLKPCKTAFFKGCCSKTEVLEQPLISWIFDKRKNALAGRKTFFLWWIQRLTGMRV
jgi:hypothetical protein